MTRNIRVTRRDIVVAMLSGGALWLYLVAVRGLVDAIPSFAHASQVWRAQVSLGSSVFPLLLVAVLAAAAMMAILRTRRIATTRHAASIGALLACIVVPSIVGAGSQAGVLCYGLIRAVATGAGLIMLATVLSLTTPPRRIRDASR